MKKTLNPYWNESFDMSVSLLSAFICALCSTGRISSFSTVKDSSVIAVQIFDQRKFKKRDQGFLGVVNVKVSDVIDLELGGHGAYMFIVSPSLAGPVARWAL